MGYAHLCGFNHRGVTIAFDSFLRVQLVSFYTASHTDWNTEALSRVVIAYTAVKINASSALVPLLVGINNKLLSDIFRKIFSDQDTLENESHYAPLKVYFGSYII